MREKKYFWLVFNAAFILFIVKIDAFIVNVSLPTIASSFHLSLAEVSGIVVVYLLLLTNTMLIFGKLEDRMGVKRLLLWGYITFTLGSLFCGLSPGIYLLVAARAIQGIGGAMLLICGAGAVNKFLPDEIKGWGLGWVTTAAALGLATGAPLGGWITHFLHWRWIFFVNVPLGLLGLVMSYATAPGDGVLTEKKNVYFDYLGAVLSFLGLSGVIYSLSMGEILGWRSPCILFIAAVALIILLLFIFWESRCPFPLLELRIFKNRGFLYGNVAVFLVFMILAGADFIVPFFLELSKGQTPFQVGFFMFLYSAVYSVCAPFTGKILDNTSWRFLSPAATVAAALLFFAYAGVMSGTGRLVLLAFFMLWAITSAFIVPENFRLVFANTPEDQKGVGSGIFNLAQNLSMVFGVCAFQLIFSLITQAADIPEPSSLVAAGWSKTRLFSAFSAIFVFCGVLYCLTLIFSFLAERAGKNSRKKDW